MVNIDNDIVQAFRQNGREISIRAIFDDLYIVGSDYLISYSINGNMGSSNALQLGYTPSRQLSLRMYVPPKDDYPINFEKCKIKVEIGISVDGTIKYTPLGVFYSESFTSDDGFKSISLTAYDSMLKFDKVVGNYTTTLPTEECTPLNILRELCTTAGVEYVEPQHDIVLQNQLIDVAHGYYSIGGYDWNFEKTDDFERVTVGKYSFACKLKHIDSNFSFRAKLPVGVDYSQCAAEIHLAESPSYFTDLGTYDVYEVINGGGPGFLKTVDGETWNFEDIGVIEFRNSVKSVNELEDIYFVITFYLPNISYEYDLKVFVDNIVKEDGANLDIPIEATFNDNYSYRAMLGYVSAYMGFNACINRDGLLIFKSFETIDNIVINRGFTLQNGNKLSSRDLYTTDLFTTGTKDHIIQIGSGEYGYNFFNPLYFITGIRSNAKNAYRYINNIKVIDGLPVYTGNDTLVTHTGKIDYFFDPRIEMGDVILYENNDTSLSAFLVLGENIDVGGGVRASLLCNISKEVSNSFYSSPSNNMVSSSSSSSVITDTKGGFVKEVYDDDGIKRAIAITKYDYELEWLESQSGCKVVAKNGMSCPMIVVQEGGVYHTADNGNTYTYSLNNNGQLETGNLTLGNSKYSDVSIEPVGTMFAENFLFRRKRNKGSTFKGKHKGNILHGMTNIATALIVCPESGTDGYGDVSYFEIDPDEHFSILRSINVDIHSARNVGLSRTNSIRLHTDSYVGEPGSSIISIESPTIFINGSPIDDTQSLTTMYMNGGETTSSDIKVKDEIVSLSDDKFEDFIMSLNPVEFVYKNGTSHRKHLGFIAQEVRDSALNTVGDLSLFNAYSLGEDGEMIPYNDETPDEDLHWYLNYPELLAPTVKLLQSYVKKNIALQQKIDSLEKRIEKLEKLIK